MLTPLSKVSPAIFSITVITFGLLSSSLKAAEPSATEANIAVASVDGVPLIKVIDAVASRTKKRFLVDPRAVGVTPKEGLELNKTTYRELQAILRLHGLVAIEVGGFVNVVPDVNSRFMPLPVIDKDSANIGEDDVVIKIIGTGKLEAARLIPLLRPMLPQYAHFAALSDTNSLLIVARYANVKTIEAVVRSLEKQPMVPKSATASAGGDSRPTN